MVQLGLNPSDGFLRNERDSNLMISLMGIWHERIDGFLTPNIPQAIAIWRLHSSTVSLSEALRRRRVGSL